ncbi:hypothetical protein [Ruegeria lacuscaerulensis]|uniref:hypothetical protein n=1 Tax=Ruegeria lacuscaerulensis TaxID=55218 RepID=UPI00147EA4BE|nr:hypothetical protein [Ruegeria lacuscaerulensis]
MYKFPRGAASGKIKKKEKCFDGNAGLTCSSHRALQNQQDGAEDMTRIADMKMALLAALIVLTSAFCVQDGDRLGEAEPELMKAPKIETRVLMG